MAADATHHISEWDTFESIQHHVSHSKRLVPADVTSEIDDDGRVPLRAEKLNRRESRIGLRSIFSRQRSANEDDFGAKGAPGRSAGIRASLVNNWPYGMHGQRSEITLPFFSHSSQPLSPSAASEPMKHRKAASAAKAQTSPGTAQRASWDPLPLSQAYPQALRHAQLPACTLPTETILRLHEQRIRQPSRDGLAATLTAGDTRGKSRRAHRHNTSGSSLKTEWTTKIFVLVPSGYLLQYAGEGSFDRPPERMLHLGKDSAAFASDVIPGRHWVLQVSSAMDPEAPPAPPTNSLFARFSSRAVERKQTSDVLMVFESAEDMESWIILLRREIQARGGKKSLSETGKPKVDDNTLQLKTQPSQRTLIMSDPDRFSTVLSQEEIPWDQAAAVAAAAAAAMVNRDIRLSTTDSDTGRDRSFDGTSTVSVISHDGRQLDGLRDSTQRLSYVSSGQRTAITSAGSSPVSSPLRDSFGSQLNGHVEELSIYEQGQTQEAQPWPQARPNASDIMVRRQSMQTTNHLAELRGASATPRPFSTTYSSSWQSQQSSYDTAPHATSPPQLIANFSVQHVADKRCSTIVQVPAETAVQSPAWSRPCRRPPPSAISINPRPLSLVVDHPSPNPSSPDSPDKQLGLPQRDSILETPLPKLSTWSQDDVQMDLQEALDRDPCVSPVQQTYDPAAHPAPRKYTSTATIRTWTITEDEENEPHPTVSAADVAALPQPWLPAIDSASAVRPRSSMADHRSTTSFSQLSTSTPGTSSFKRFSLQSPSSKVFDRFSGIDACTDVSITITSIPAEDSSNCAHNRARPKSTQSITSTDSANRPLSLDQSRQSVTNLADIPPPAPPPTCALPPLPAPRRNKDSPTL